MKRKSLYSAEKSAFTLAELLVVIAIISLLLGLLIPKLQKARHQAKQTVCLAQLNTIGKACYIYALENNDRFPGPYATGNHGFRQAIGKKTEFEPRALPERYGLAAVLDRTKSMNGFDKAWVCPAAAKKYVDYGNSYSFSVARQLDIYPVSSLKRITDQWLVWDNYLLEPGLTGFRGPFRYGYTIREEERKYSHLPLLPPALKDMPQRSCNAVFYDCHAEPLYKIPTYRN